MLVLITFVLTGFLFELQHFGHFSILKSARKQTRAQWISPTSQIFNENNVAQHARNLIIVAGHSVTAAGHLEDANEDESDWVLLPYQQNRGLPQAIVSHISTGIREAHLDPKSLLVFSGGESRANSGPDTEGASYFRVADAMDLWPKNSDVRSRTLAEEYARDSFENLLFSICRFREVTSQYPQNITVVSFSFKKRRFLSMHANAIRWPAKRFFYIGVDPSPSTGFNLLESTVGELENALKPFETDPYGCHTPVLREKRNKRNPFYRRPPYDLTCPEMKGLLNHCGPSLYPTNHTPWCWNCPKMKKKIPKGKNPKMKKKKP